MQQVETAVIIAYALIILLIYAVFRISRKIDARVAADIKRDFERESLKSRNMRQMMFLADSLAKNLFQDYKRVVVTWEPRIHHNLLRGEVIALLHAKEPKIVSNLSRVEYDLLVDNLASALHTMYYESKYDDDQGIV